MEPLTVLSAAGQVAEHLRGELLSGGLRGKMPGVEPLAEELGVDHKTVRAALRHLEDEGLLVSEGQGRHRRIVFLQGRGSQGQREHKLWREVFSEFERNGIRTGDYNLPRWKDSRDGFRSLLDSLFAHTPPTALVIEEIPHLIATLQYCGQRGIRVPQDLSIACLSASPDFDYCHPTVAHVRWDSPRLLKRINRWVDNVARGGSGRRQIYEATRFVEGGTIGAAPKTR